MKAIRPSKADIEKMNKTMSEATPDIDATISVINSLSSDTFSLECSTDEEIDANTAVDFSVIDETIPDIEIPSVEEILAMNKKALRSFLFDILETAKTVYDHDRKTTEQLSNAREIMIWLNNKVFGKSSQRTGKKAEKQSAAVPAEESNNGQDVQPDQPEKKKKRQPKRSKGCLDNVCKKAKTLVKDILMTQEELDEKFGVGNWKETNGFVEQKEYRFVPAQMFVISYRYRKYVVKDEKGKELLVHHEYVAERVYDKSRMSPSLLAEIMYMNRHLRIPMNRVKKDLETYGFEFSHNWVESNLEKFTMQYLGAIYQRLFYLLKQSGYIQADETWIREYLSTEKRYRKNYLWLFRESEMINDNKSITVFHYGNGRSKKVLKECIFDFSGTVESDGYNVYHIIAKESDGRIKNAGCLNHLRSKVMNALNTIDTSKMTPAQQKNVPAQVIVSKIDEIFQEEKKVKELKTAEERKKYRNNHVKKLFSELEDLFDKININELIVNSAMYKAVTYFNNQKEYLKVFLDDGNVCAQNSACERAFALVAILRNQTKMISSRKGGICRAILESIEQTAANHVENIKHYYHYLIRKLPKFIDSYCVEHKTTHEKTDFSKVAEIDVFLPWSEEFIAYYKQKDNEEKNLLLSTI